MKNVKLWSKWKYILCFIGAHHWTCKAIEGIPPDPILPDDTVEEVMKRFQEYSTMYCKTCGKISRLNGRFTIFRNYET